MKICVGGDGSNTTAAVQAWLSGNNNLPMANLYLIGEPEHPRSLWLTDYGAPLYWSAVARAFQTTVIRRSTVTANIGFEVQKLKITWSPRASLATQSVFTASPYQLARMGYFDNWPVRVWTCYLPNPGDADTFGCSELFGGTVANTSTKQGSIEFTVNSFLDVVNQYVPTNVIELLNTVASYKGATPPPGYTQLPQFTVVSGSSTNVIVGQQTSPNAGAILHTNSIRGGFLVFNTINPDPLASPPVLGSTLGGVWSPIEQNTDVPSLPNANQFVLYGSLPWPPTAGRDTFYIGAPAPMNKEDGEYYGFMFVPQPEAAA